VKLVELFAVPPAVVTVMAPVLAPAGTVAVIWVLDTMVNVAAVPRNFTAVAPVRPVPVMVTVAPTGALVGVKPVMVAVTLKAVELVAVPPVVVTDITPVVAAAGTVAVTWVLDATVNVAVVPWNFTAVAPVRPVPVMVTVVPTGPLAGVNPVMVGLTTNEVVVVPVPLGVVTLIVPVVAVAGTAAVIWLYETTV
jgi:hypothetical protein